MAFDRRELELDRKSVPLKPRDAGKLNNEGCDHLAAGRPAVAVMRFTDALRADPKFHLAHLNRAVAYHQLQKYAEAVADCDAGLKLTSREPGLWRLRGDCKCELQDYTGAVKDLQQAVKLDPKSARAWFLLGFCRIESDEPEEAVADLTKAIRLDPDQSPAWFQRGRVHFYLSKGDEAVADLTRAIELNPDNAGALYHRGRTYFELDETERALADFTRAIELVPDWPAPRAYRAEVLTGLDDREEEALADAEVAVRELPAWVVARRARALALACLGRYDEAVADLSRAIDLDPTAAAEELYQLRGNAHFHGGDDAAALADFDRALAGDPANEAALVIRARLHCENGRYEEAVRDCTAALAVVPDDPEGLHVRAKANAKIGRRDEAFADAEALRDAEPTVEAICYRAELLVALGEVAAGIAEYERAIEADPGDPQGPNDLALVLATHADPRWHDRPRATALAQEAVTRADAKAEWREGVRDTLATVLAAAGDFGAAVAMLEDVVSKTSPSRMRREYQHRLELFRQGQVYIDPRW